MIKTLAPLNIQPLSRGPGFRIPYPLTRALTAPAFLFFPPSVLALRLTYPFCGWDEAVTRAHFRRTFKREIDLVNSVTFSEKISWLKLFDRRPIQKIMADKVTSHDFVRERGHGDILLERYGVWDSPEEVPLEDLPETFALKASHGWKMNWFRMPGDPLPIREIRRTMRRWVRTDHSEWQYRDTRRRLLAEPLLRFPGGVETEYRFCCFGGVPRFVQVRTDQYGRSQTASAHFDMDWRQLPFWRRGQRVIENAQRPVQFDRMIEIAADLSASEPFLRIDLNELEGRIIFTEMTFRPYGGAFPIDPPEWDIRLGSWIDLPCVTV